MKKNKNVSIPVYIGLVFFFSSVNSVLADNPHVYQYAVSLKKTESQSHQQSYETACKDAQSAEIKRWGAEYRLADFTCADNGRTIESEQAVSPSDKEAWKCTHTVTITYTLERKDGRGHDHSHSGK